MLLGLNEWYARHVGRQSAEQERASVLAEQTALRFRQSRMRYDQASRAARVAVGQAAVARRKVRVVDRQTLDVEGENAPVLVPPAVTDLIIKQDTALARMSIALLQADTTIAKADTALRASRAEAKALRKRIPRFGFRTGVVVGTGVVLLVRALLR